MTVQYGASAGIGTSRAALISQSTSGVAGSAETGDRFGAALATGDLDADGYDDAIVGTPGRTSQPPPTQVASPSCGVPRKG